MLVSLNHGSNSDPNRNRKYCVLSIIDIAYSMRFRFAVISDLHYGSPAIQKTKPIDAFIKRIAKPDISFVVATGDLTDSGYDGEVSCSCIPYNTFFSGGSKENQAQECINDFVTPIDSYKKPLYLIQGNHDTYNGASRYPVANYIKKRHGDLYYSIKHENVLMFFCDIYPTSTIRIWMKTELESEKCKENNTPILIFFHYNLCDEFSDWWSENEKNDFANCIQDYNVLGIFVGHYHKTYTYKWNGFNVYSSAGTEYIIATIENNCMTTVFERHE